MSKSPLSLAVNNSLRVSPGQTVAEILAEPLPTYTIRPLLAHRAVHVLYGDANTGKTFFALDVAARISTGGAWRGRRIKAAPVLYVAAEGIGGFGKRLRALVQQHPGLLAAPLRIIRQPIDLIGDIEDLMVRARDLEEDQGRLGLIALDTLAQTMGGRDENGPDMALFVARAALLAEKTGAAVLIVHHAGKNALAGARGHSSLRGNTDAIYKIATNDDGIRSVTIEKSRDDNVKPFAYTLRAVGVGTDGDGEEQTSCIVEYCDDYIVAAARRPLPGTAQRLLYRLAGEVAAGSAEAGRLAPSGRPVIERSRLIETWQAARAAAGRKQVSPSSISRPLADLVAAGYLQAAGNDAWTLV